MREIRKSGSEGGAGQNNVPFLPLSPPKVQKLSPFGMKSDFRLGRNFLKSQVGDAINLLLAAAASNLSL
jgi:hypothetical protein